MKASTIALILMVALMVVVETTAQFAPMQPQVFEEDGYRGGGGGYGPYRGRGGYGPYRGHGEYGRRGYGYGGDEYHGYETEAVAMLEADRYGGQGRGGYGGYGGQGGFGGYGGRGGYGGGFRQGGYGGWGRGW